MKVLCNREKLREALSVVSNVIPSKSTKPILQSVRIEAKKGKVEISATDLEVAVRFRIDEAEVEKEGVLILPAKIADFIRDLGDEGVHLVSEGNNCHVKGLSDACTLVGQNPEEFPKIPEFEEKQAYRIPAENLSQLAKRTSFAAAREMGRYAMNGILLEISSESVRMVATDGRRLAMADGAIEKGPKETVSAIVPSKGIAQFLRCIDPDTETVDLALSNNQVAMKTGKAQVFVRLLEGEFPKYQAVIPKDSQNHTELDRTKLIQKLQLVANLTGEESRSVKWTFTPDRVKFSAESPGRGEAKAELEAKTKMKGAADLQVCFNPDYVIEALKASEAETVRFEFTDKDRPGKFLLGENYIYVAMPITLE